MGRNRMDDKEKLKRLKDDERKEIIDRVNVMRKQMLELENILLPSNKPGEIQQEEADNKVVPILKNDPGNVFFILPDVSKTYHDLSSSKMPFLTFVEQFENWVLRLRLATNLNQKHLKTNRTLRAHLIEVLGICRIIDIATKNYFDE